MFKQPGTQQCYQHSSSNTRNVLQDYGKIGSPRAADLVAERQEHGVKQRPEAVKLMQIFAGQEHPGYCVVIDLVEGGDSEGWRAGVLQEESNPDDQTEYEKKQ